MTGTATASSKGDSSSAASKAFSIAETKFHVQVVYKDGAWGTIEKVESPYISMHMGATALHYGQAVFEGLKAFLHPDGSLNLFRPDCNHKRMNASAERLMMPSIPEDLFLDAVKMCVKGNADCLGEYSPDNTKSLYIRPFMFGSGPQLAVTPAEEFMFIVFVTPVGSYYAGGPKPVTALVSEENDRAAPRGIGSCKAAGNYAPSLIPEKLAKSKGFSLVLYLDAAERKYIEEFGTSNFIGITRDGTYVTPKSSSILPSITNMSLIDLCKQMNIPVERRKIDIAEVKNGDFVEAAACGTAVVITPVKEIHYKETSYYIGDDKIGPVLEKLYNTLTAIQQGKADSKMGWIVKV
eukprot:Nk52_evm43s292 gene=Nk52_evmTU43s292